MIKIKRTRNKNILDPFQRSAIPDPVTQTQQQETGKEKKTSKSPKYKLWFVAGVSLIFFIFALSYLFGRATITVNPKIKEITLNEDLSARRDEGVEALPFDLVVISGEEIKTVQTIEKKEILQKAEGVVVLYNTFGSSSQALDIDTRLEGSNGKIYKTKTRTVIPGMKGGKPGSVEVKVYGSDAGVEYNSVPLDFKILGFKGTSKYAKFYGRSKGDITGGLAGKFPFIGEEERVSLESELKTILQAKLFKKATNQIPSGFILFKDAVFLKIDSDTLDLSSAKDNMLPIKITGTLYGFLFSENKLTKKIAENNIEKYDGSEVYIPNIRNLIFSLPAGENILFRDVKNINFNLSGATQIVYKLDIIRFVADLLGKSKKDFNQILLQYPNIDSAKSVMSLFWKRSFPDKSKNIKVIVNYPK